MTTVRKNLLTRLEYTPYCGNIKCKDVPRTSFNGKQFKCSSCGWESTFEQEFIDKYKAAQQTLKDNK